MEKTKNQLPKSLTGIHGLDEITGGGLPTGRPTLVCGGAGCGKTLLAMEFLVRGATQFNEPGVIMSFEETAQELSQNIASLGFDLDELVKQKKIFVDYVYVERSEIEETGEYDLEGLFIRLGHAIDTVQAKRVVLDTIETLFSGFSNTLILRAELRRLFRWLKNKGVTTIITGERGDGTLTRQGLEEYVSDCVIFLDQRVNDQITTRRLRVVKYRGSIHGTNEYPYLITENGISLLPITSLILDQIVSTERVSTGISGLDDMMGGKGFFRGSSVLISGTAGSGKSSISAHYANAAGQRGERVLYFSFEESQSQIVRNMRSIGIDLEQWVNKGNLRFHMTRPTLYGMELHLSKMVEEIISFKPTSAIIDPVTSFLAIADEKDAKSLFLRLVDFLKSNQITSLFTSLTAGGAILEATEVGISSLIDTWLLLRDLEGNGERNRALYLIKSRGMAHSNQVREFRLTDHGAELVNVYVGPKGVLTGSARLVQEEQDKAAQLAQYQEISQQQTELERNRKTIEAKITALRSELEAEQAKVEMNIKQAQTRDALLALERGTMATNRQTD